MASIADVFFKALLDTAQLQVDAVKAGNKAGETMGQTMSKGLKTGLKFAAVGGLTAGLTLATKGVIELENVTADFTAQTGVAGDAAKEAGKAINAMAGSNIQPMAEIGDALAKVHTDLGLTGDAAVATTKQFLRFGRATKQNAAAAVLAFDDILDSWGLTAERAAGLMDQLIVSHQKFGGSIEDNQRTLAALAPAMKAANFQIDDGIALLNLFGAKGLDANTASAAFAKALTKVKSPAELKALIVDIQNTVDPFERADKAAKLFGARAGAKLANALGDANLDDYTVTVEEAAGATEDAAAAMDNTFGARMQLLLKGFTSALTGLGAEFGPVLTGLAALTSLASTLRLDRALSGMFGKLGAAGAVRGAASAAGAKIGAVFQAALAGVQKLAGAIAGLFGKLPGSGVVRAAVTRAGAALGALLGTATSAVGGITSKFTAAIAGLFDKLPGSSKVKDAVVFAGAKLGAAFQLAFAAGAAVLIGVTLGTELKKHLPTELLGPGGMGYSESQLAHMRMAAMETGKTQGEAFTQGAVDGLSAGGGEVATAAGDVGDAIDEGIGDGADAAVDTVESATAAILTAFGTLRSDLGAAAGAAAGAIFDPIIKEAELAQTRADIAEQNRIIKDKKSTADQVAEAKLRRTELNKQLLLQVTDLTTYGTDAERIAKIDAALATQSVADAYRDGTPEQKAAIDEWRAALVAERAKLTGAAATSGDKTVGAYTGALRDGKPDITKAAGTATSGIDDEFRMTNEGYRWGANTTAAYARGIASMKIAVRNAAVAVAKQAQYIFRAYSPPGPASPLHDIDEWGENTIQAWVDGILAKARDVRQAAATVSAAAAPSMMAPDLGRVVPVPGAPSVPLGAALATATAASGGDVYNINVPVSGLIKARDPLEVAGQLRRLAEAGVLAPKRTSYT